MPKLIVSVTKKWTGGIESRSLGRSEYQGEEITLGYEDDLSETVEIKDVERRVHEHYNMLATSVEAKLLVRKQEWDEHIKMLPAPVAPPSTPVAEVASGGDAEWTDLMSRAKIAGNQVGVDRTNQITQEHTRGKNFDGWRTFYDRDKKCFIKAVMEKHARGGKDAGWAKGDLRKVVEALEAAARGDTPKDDAPW